MPVLERRLQVLVDPHQYRRLEDAASASNRSVASIVREAIDALVRDDAAARRAAAERILARPTQLDPEPDWSETKAALEEDLERASLGL
ncbi:MAG: hypothetical protein FWD59_08200 [Micrococcales bacterium]|nr:hypothetical protein [Micrococcales bacterium]